MGRRLPWKMFRLKDDDEGDRTRWAALYRRPWWGWCEVNMSHRKNTSGQAGVPRNEDSWKTARALADWDTDTDVMPPEYCRQLLAISRLLEQPR